MKFVLVNGRTPHPHSFCALCCEPIGESTCEILQPASPIAITSATSGTASLMCEHAKSTRGHWRPAASISRQASNRARQDKLEQRGRSVTEIALTLWFRDTSSFSTAFRRETGNAPTEGRRCIGEAMTAMKQRMRPRSGQATTGPRCSRPDPRLVYRRAWHARSEGGQGLARQAGSMRLVAIAINLQELRTFEQTELMVA
jgi:AraC-like DNA-binding protein